MNQAKGKTEAILAAAATSQLAQTSGGAAAQYGQATTVPAQIIGAAGESARTTALIAALMAAIVAYRRRTKWIEEVIRPEFTAQEITDAEIKAAADAEADREEAFINAMRERLQRDIPQALKQPLPLAAVDAVLEREERYMAQHDDAVAARVKAALQRGLVKGLSPEGAFWVLGVGVKEHTPDCIAMASVGWWPWSVLDRINPPVHTGCQCDLLTHDEAIGMGYMTSKLPDTSGADEEAQRIIDEYDVELREAAEPESFDELMEIRWNRRYAEGTIWGGRFMPARGGFAPRISIADVLRKLGDNSPHVVGRGSQRTINASHLGMNTPSKGKGKKAKAKLEQAVDSAELNTAGRLNQAQAFYRARAEKHGSKFTELNYAVQGTGGTRFESDPRVGGDPSKALIQIGIPEATAIEQAREKRASGSELGDHEAARYYDARRAINHEHIHNVSAISEAEYADENNRTAFALEEALTEELAHQDTMQQLREEGDIETLRWLAANPNDPNALGVYRPQRQALLEVLDLGDVPMEDRHKLLEELSMEYTDTESRIARLGDFVASAQGIDHQRAQDVVRGALQMGGQKDGVLTYKESAHLFPDAGILTQELDLQMPDVGFKKGDVVRIPGKTEAGKVMETNIAPTGEIQIAVEIKDNGRIYYAYPNAAEVEKLASAPKTTLKGDKVTGRVREGDRVKIWTSDGGTKVGTLEKVIASDKNGFAADVREENGKLTRYRHTTVRDVRKARPDSRSRPAPEKPKVVPVPLGGEGKPTQVSGPRGYDSRKYADPRRALIRKVEALPPGETLTLAEGSEITRGKRGSALIIRPDGSQKRYATPSRLSNAEIDGITARTGPKSGMSTPADGDPKDHKSLAFQNTKDGSLDRLVGMASPGAYTPDDKHLDRVASVLTRWVEDPNAALAEADQDQIDALKHEVETGYPGEGPFYRGQAVQHPEPLAAGGRSGAEFRGWSRSLPIAIDFATNGAEIRRKNGKRQRAKSTVPVAQVDELEVGDKLIISMYEVEESNAGLDVTGTIELAEEQSMQRVGQQAQEAYDQHLKDKLPNEINDVLSDLDPTERERAASILGTEPDNLEDAISRIDQPTAENLLAELDKQAADQPRLREFVDETGQTQYETRNTNLVDRWDRRKREIYDDYELDALTTRQGYSTDYGEEEEVILDNSALQGYRRVDVLLAVGGQPNDMSRLAIQDKVKEALKNGGYEPPEVNENQLALDMNPLQTALDADWEGKDPWTRPSLLLAAAMRPNPKGIPTKTDELKAIRSSAEEADPGVLATATREQAEAGLEKLNKLVQNPQFSDDPDKMAEQSRIVSAVQNAAYAAEEAIDDHYPERPDVEIAVGMASPVSTRGGMQSPGEAVPGFSEVIFGSEFRGVPTKDLPDIDSEAKARSWTERAIARAKDIREKALVERDRQVSTAAGAFGDSMAQAVAAQPLGVFYDSWRNREQPQPGMASPAAVMGEVLQWTSAAGEWSSDSGIQGKAATLLWDASFESVFAEGILAAIEMGWAHAKLGAKLHHHNNKRRFAKLFGKPEPRLADTFLPPDEQPAMGMASPGVVNKLQEMARSLIEAPPDKIVGIPDYRKAKLTDVKAAGGSNDARIAEDSNGNQWLVKAYRGDKNRVATELLSNSIYRELGVDVPEAGVGTNNHPQYGKQDAVTYPLVEGKERRWSEPNARLAEGFVADALLANWDVIGLTQDNILWSGDTPIRLDQGGTLEYRAQGKTKEFGPVPSELWTMQSERGQANGRMDITEAGMLAQARDVELRLTPTRIDYLVDKAPFADEAMRERVRENLKARVAWLGRFSRGEEGLPEPLEQAEAKTYFQDRDAELVTLPNEDQAMEDYFGGLADEVDTHLRSGAPAEEATDEVFNTVAEIDALLKAPDTQLDEDIVGWAELPNIENPDALQGSWVTEKSFLPLDTEFEPTPGTVAIKMKVPAGAHAVMPSEIGVVSAPDGQMLLGRNSKIHVVAVRQANGAVVLEAILKPS